MACRSLMMLVVGNAHNIDYAEVKKDFFDMINNLSDAEVYVMWRDPLNAKFPSIPSLDKALSVEPLLRHALDTARKDCEKMANTRFETVVNTFVDFLRKEKDHEQ